MFEHIINNYMSKLDRNNGVSCYKNKMSIFDLKGSTLQFEHFSGNIIVLDYEPVSDNGLTESLHIRVGCTVVPMFMQKMLHYTDKSTMVRVNKRGVHAFFKKGNPFLYALITGKGKPFVMHNNQGITIKIRGAKLEYNKASKTLTASGSDYIHVTKNTDTQYIGTLLLFIEDRIV